MTNLDCIGATGTKLLPLQPMLDVSRLEDSLKERDIHPLMLSKALACSIGVLESAPAV